MWLVLACIKTLPGALLSTFQKDITLTNMFDKYSTIGFKLKDEIDLKTLLLTNGGRTQYYDKTAFLLGSCSKKYLKFRAFVILLTFIFIAFKNVLVHLQLSIID